MTRLNLDITNYNGPLDLLVELVREHRMDIFAVDLNELAKAYMQFLSQMQKANLDLASEYLVMAATLLHLKTKLILASPLEVAEAEQEKTMLLTRLADYYRFKKAATQLRTFEAKRELLFFKPQNDLQPFVVPTDPSALDGSSDAIALHLSLRKLLERANLLMQREASITSFNLSPAERRLELIDMYQVKTNLTFNDMMRVPTLNHYVVTFLTLLDMARRGEIMLYQTSQFGAIEVTKGVLTYGQQ